MVKAKTKSLNILIPDELSDWFTDYAKSNDKTKTEIICGLLQGIKNDDAYPDVDKSIDNSVDSIETMVKAYLDKHLHNHVDSYMVSKEVTDIESHAENDVEINIEAHLEPYVVTDVETHVFIESLPIIEEIANLTSPSIEKSLDSNTIATSKKSKITYRLSNDGSVVLRSLVGTSIKLLKRMTDDELRANGLFKTLIGKDEKFFPNDESLELQYQEKAIAASTKPNCLTRPEALAIAQSFNPKVTGQNLYDWAKAALTAKSDESKIANSEKLAAIGLVAVFTPENKPAWTGKS